MLIDGDCVKDVMDQLQAEDFYLRQNREIFETIAHMFVYSQPVDGVTVASEMEKNGLYTDATRPYLLQLMEVTPTSANVGEYVKIVRDKALMRQVATAAANITAMVQEGGASAADMLESAEQKVYAIRRGRSAQNMVPVSQILQDVMNRLEELSNSGNAAAGGPSRYGKDQYGAERGAVSGERFRQDRGHLLAGNVPRAAGHPPDRR